MTMVGYQGAQNPLFLMHSPTDNKGGLSVLFVWNETVLPLRKVRNDVDTGRYFGYNVIV